MKAIPHLLTISVVAFFATAHARAAPDDPVVFGHPVMAQAVLEELRRQGVPDLPQAIEELTEGQVAQVIRIAPDELGTWFWTDSLDGLQFATSLESLELNLFDSLPALDLSPIANLSSLRILNLTTQALEDISPLSQLLNLESLTLFNCQLVTCPDISSLTKLTELNLGENRILDISPLQNHSGLTHVDLSYNGFSDLSPLAGHTQIRTLNVGGNRISDLSPISTLVELEEFVARSNPMLIALAPLSALVSLIRIELTECSITDISPLAQLSDVQWIDLSENLLETLPDMDGLTSLNVLRVKGNFLDATPGEPEEVEISKLRARGVLVEDIPQFDPYDLILDDELEAAVRLELDKPIGWISPADMANLTSLVWLQGGIDSLVGLEYAVNLELLDLSENLVSDLSPLAGLQFLRDLDVASNRIVDLGPLSGLHSLRELDIAYNSVTNVQALANLTDLDCIDLDGSGLDTTPGSPSQIIIEQLEAAGVSLDVNGRTWPATDFTDLKLRAAVVAAIGFEGRLITPTDLLPLRRLNVSAGGISNLTGLQDAVNLEALQASDNDITDLSPLASLQQLKVLDISGNSGLGDLSPISGWTELRYLDMGGLPTADLSALTNLSNLDHLLIGAVFEPAAVAVIDALESGGTSVYENLPVTQPQPGELAISEIHFRPREPDANEISSEFLLRSDFEYLEMVNLADTTIELGDLVFGDGIDFRFADGIYQRIPPGFRIALVKNLAAFELRFGSEFSHLIDGIYTGKLGDDGEQLRIQRGHVLIRTVNFEPWYDESDGQGHSLILLDEDRARSNDSEQRFWRNSAQPGQGPFVSDVYTYAMWVDDHFGNLDLKDPTLVEPNKDPDGDGTLNSAEYAFGSSPWDARDGGHTRVFSGFDTDGAQKFSSISYFRHPFADEAIITVENSRDLRNWSSARNRVTLDMGPLPTTDHADGSDFWRFRSAFFVRAGRDDFLRLTVRLRE